MADAAAKKPPLNKINECPKVVGGGGRSNVHKWVIQNLRIRDV
jgi:hypothetical protein